MAGRVDWPNQFWPVKILKILILKNREKAKGWFYTGWVEQNKWKMFFSHTAGALGHVTCTCKCRQLFFVDCLCLTFPPTHRGVFQLFISRVNVLDLILGKFMFWPSMYTCIFCEAVIFIMWIKVRLAVVGLTWLPGVWEESIKFKHACTKKTSTINAKSPVFYYRTCKP